MKESDWIFRVPHVSRRGFAMAIAELAMKRRDGMALWIQPGTWEIILLPAGCALAQTMLDGSCAGPGLVAGYVGVYRGKVLVREVLDDLDHHCPRAPWARSAEAA